MSETAAQPAMSSKFVKWHGILCVQEPFLTSGKTRLDNGELVPTVRYKMRPATPKEVEEYKETLGK